MVSPSITLLTVTVAPRTGRTVFVGGAACLDFGRGAGLGFGSGLGFDSGFEAPCPAASFGAGFAASVVLSRVSLLASSRADPWVLFASLCESDGGLG